MTSEAPADLPIKRSSVAGHVVERFLDLLRTGKLKPGDQLPSGRDLAQMLRVDGPSLPRGKRQPPRRYSERQNHARAIVQKLRALCESCLPIDGAGARIITAVTSRNAATAEEAIVAHVHDVHQSTFGAREELRGGRA